MLGTGSPIPDPNRAGPCALVRAGGRNLLVDCGRGALMRLAGAGVMPPGVHSVLLTHLHSDHITDLNDLITMRWAMLQTDEVLPIYGPPGTAEVVERTLAMLEHDVGYRVDHHADLTWQPRVEVTELTEGPVLAIDGLTVTAEPTEHRPVHPTIGFRFEADGGVLVLAGDTIPCDGLDRLVAGADVYVQTTIRRSLIEMLPIARLQDILDYHSDIEQAAQTATRGAVGTLVLNHCVPGVAAGFEQPWIDEASAGFAGTILLPADGDVITVGG